MMSTNAELDRLDSLARALIGGEGSAAMGLSTSERVYVFLAASRSDLLEQEGYTIPQALNRIGDRWLAELIQRW